MHRSNKLLEVNTLECVRGHRKLFSDLSFTVDPGTILHVQGPNGSGKTTLLRAVCGLLRPQEGTIIWDGANILTTWEDFCRDTLYLGHLDGIKLDLTSIENLRLAVAMSGQDVSEQALLEIFVRIGLVGLEDLQSRVLSQGQRRRVALARLFVSNAKLWILDEPFVGLDRSAVGLIVDVIAQHLAQGGLVMLTTHQDVALNFGTIQQLQMGSVRRNV